MQHTTTLKPRFTTLLADTFTPVSIYLQVRDVFPNSILLESSDYHGNENSCSYICCKPIAGFVVENSEISCRLPDGSHRTEQITSNTQVMESLRAFIGGFQTERLDIPYLHDGIFGYMTYDAVQYCEDIKLTQETSKDRAIPTLQYHLYQFVIILNHFTNEAFLIEQVPTQMPESTTTTALEGNDELQALAQLISKKTFATYRFEPSHEETSNFTDEEFISTLEQIKPHIYRGDVFQIVPSRRFQRTFKGDDFNAYRALRSVNPSPYLFYFDYGSFRLMGSSPEAQIIVHNGKAEIPHWERRNRRTSRCGTAKRPQRKR
jgi:anthranilate synthase component I